MSLRPARDLHQYRAIRRAYGDTDDVVTAAELRTYLKADSTLLPDDEATELIAEARAYIEAVTNLAIVGQSVDLVLDNWPTSRGEWWSGVRQGAIADLHAPDTAARLELPIWPLISVDSVKTYAADSSETTVAVADTFDVDIYSNPGRIGLKSGKTWPSATRPTNAIIITYSAGYGVVVPAPMKRAVKALAAHLWSHRGDGCEIGSAYADSGAKALMAAYTVVRV